MQYNNFSISRKKGKFYLKEKQPTDGYEEVTYGEGKKTYHKYFNKIEGTPKYFGVKEVEYDGRKLYFLELSLENGDVFNKISTNLKNKNGYSDETKALISALNGYKMGEPVSVTAKTSTYKGNNGKTYENFNIYINYDNIKNEQGKGQSTGYIKYEDIPNPVKGDDGMGGITWDWTPTNKFYYEKLQEIEERFKNNGGQTNTPAEQKPQKKEEPVTAGNNNVDDSLPF